MLKSIACRADHFSEEWYRETVQTVWPVDPGAIHRKVWEYVAIYRALDERGMLTEGRTGLGFAVGREPLAGLFANRSVDVLATDIACGSTADAWNATRQHAAAKEALFDERLHDRNAFQRHVEFRVADMTNLSGVGRGAFDFIWSACALEHLGSLEAGMTFVKRSTQLLRPGGVSVHTTELNISSDDGTIDQGNTVIYRERDFRKLDRELRELDAGLVTLDLDPGTHEYDIKADYMPYHENGRQHLKLRLLGYISTSVLLIVQN
jgi:hypothetical protein